MGAFRDRMEEDLRLRGYSPSTIRCYLARVRQFVAYFMRPPDQLTPEHVRTYQVHLTDEVKVGWAVFNQTVCALRFFFRVSLGKDWPVEALPYRRTAKRLPVVLSRLEVRCLLDQVSNLKYRTLLTVGYATGLRISEVLHLRVSDIDSQRMTVRVEQGKRRKDRYVMLSPKLLELLQEYTGAVPARLLVVSRRTTRSAPHPGVRREGLPASPSRGGSEQAGHFSFSSSCFRHASS